MELLRFVTDPLFKGWSRFRGMNQLFAYGFAAGLALAIPLGPIAILMIQTATQRGWRHGAASALGAATVDTTYSLVTFALGSALTAWLGSYRLVLTLIGVSILLFLGLRTLVTNIGLFRTPDNAELPHTQPRSLGATYLTFVSATAINPPTALYFLAIAPSIGPLAGDSPWLGAVVFALGVFVASVGWGNALAAVGTGLRQITTNRVRAALGILGGALIVVLTFGLAANAFNA